MRSRRTAPVEVLRIEAEDLDAGYSPELRAISVRPLPAPEVQQRQPTAPRGTAVPGAADGPGTSKGTKGFAAEGFAAPSDPAAAVWQADGADEAGSPKHERRSPWHLARVLRWAATSAAVLGIVVATAIGADSRVHKRPALKAGLGKSPVLAVVGRAPKAPRPHQRDAIRRAPRRRRAPQRRSRRPARTPAPVTSARPATARASVAATPTRRSPARVTPVASDSEFGIEVGP
jgi:hypothetical protein